MKPSEVHVDNFGNSYVDIFSNPINDFKPKEGVRSYALTELDLYRFDLLIYKIYGNANYDDFILWYNNIENIKRVKTGTEIILPAKKDIDDFYREKTI